MKYFLVSLLALCCSTAFSQEVVPGSSAIDKSLIRPSSYKMNWSMVSGNEKREIGETNVDVIIEGDKLLIIQEVFLKNISAKWIDTTEVKMSSLLPVYHSSYNMMRDMTLIFKPGKVVGSYVDKKSKQTSQISDTVKGKFFDSNFYPYLIAWLPLKEGYKASIPIYNYSDNTNHGIFNVEIEGVKESRYKPENGESIDVYEVSVKDPTSNTSTIYFIGKQNRIVYQINAQTPRGTMQMIRITANPS